MNNESFVSVSLSGICVWCEQFSLQTGLQHKQHRMPLRRKSCKYLLIPMITTSQITAIFKHSLLVGNSFESYNDGELLPRSSIHKCMRYIYCFVDIESLVSVDVYLQTLGLFYVSGMVRLSIVAGSVSAIRFLTANISANNSNLF